MTAIAVGGLVKRYGDFTALASAGASTWASPSSAGRNCCSSTSPPPVLDEPAAGPDPEARRRLWTAIENLTTEGGTVLLTTHYLDEAQHLASRVIVLADGRVAADATPAELRAMGGAPAIRFRLPARAPALPRAVARHVLRGQHAAAVGRRDRGTGHAGGVGPALARHSPPVRGYFAGRIIASVLLADGAGVILLIVAMPLAHRTSRREPTRALQRPGGGPA